MKHSLIAVLALAACCAAAPAHAETPAASPEPKCGTNDAPKSCISLTAGAVTVKTRDVGREYVTTGLAYDTPAWKGFQGSVMGDVFAAQDGAGTEGGQARTFRVFKLGAQVTKDAGPIFVSAIVGTTFSIEGLQGAPADPRQWDALVDVRLPIGADGLDGYVSLRGGHDGAVGGWAAGADIAIPVAKGAPAIVARYELPLYRDPNGRVPWVITGGARVRLASFRIGK